MKVVNKEGNGIVFDRNGVDVDMEYRYLEYQVTDGYVVKITTDLPTVIEEGHKMAISNNINFEVGYEFDNYIVVQEVNENGSLLSSCMVKQPDSVKFLRQERDILKLKNEQLTAVVADQFTRMEQMENDSVAFMDYVTTTIEGGL
jgi:hypothetical protein